MYRPLSPNEYSIVSQVIYQERGLTGGLAESMFMAYKGRALALDEPEFVIFEESEVERKARLAEKQRDKDKVVELNTGRELEPMEFLRKLEALGKHDKPSTEPKNSYEWFYGDESKLDARFKRLRVKFFNSPTYRKRMLQKYLDYGILQDAQLNDFPLIGEIVGEFHRKYPGTRQGIVSDYETFFGDGSGLCYEFAMRRKAFHSDLTEYLKARNFPLDWGIEEVKQHLKEDALEGQLVTLEQIAQWEGKTERSIKNP